MQSDKAIDYYEQALVISRAIGDKHGEGNRLNNLGEAYEDLEYYNQAIQYIEPTMPSV